MGIPLYGQNKQGGQLQGLIDSKRVYKFENPPVCVDDAMFGGINTLIDGADNSNVIHQYDDGLSLCFNFEQASDIDGPPITSTGMNYGDACDNTGNDGCQWLMVHPSAKGSEGVNQFTIGRRAFYAKLEMSIATTGSCDELGFGFRAKAAFAALPQTYTDYVMLNVDNGDIKIQGALNDTDESDVDSTDNWADGEIHTLAVYVSKAGAATFKLDGRDPTVNTFSMTFDTGDVVSPFWFCLKDTTAAVTCILRELEVGYQDEADNLNA